MYKRSLMELQQMCLFSVLEPGSLTSVVAKSAISIERLISSTSLSLPSVFTVIWLFVLVQLLCGFRYESD